MNNDVLVKWEELKQLVEALELDVAKNARGVASAGVRARKGLRALQGKSKELVKLTIELEKKAKESSETKWVINYMRSFNKARLIDISDKGLDPKLPHVVGPDGRLTSNLPPEKDSQLEAKDEKNDVDQQTSVVQEQEPIIFAQTNNVEKKSKKSTKKSN